MQKPQSGSTCVGRRNGLLCPHSWFQSKIPFQRVRQFEVRISPGSNDNRGCERRRRGVCSVQGKWYSVGKTNCSEGKRGVKDGIPHLGRGHIVEDTESPSKHRPPIRVLPQFICE